MGTMSSSFVGSSDLEDVDPFVESFSVYVFALFKAQSVRSDLASPSSRQLVLGILHASYVASKSSTR